MTIAKLIKLINDKEENISHEDTNKTSQLDNTDTTSFYIELIYLFNPISLLNCIQMKLDIFYTLVNFIFILNRNNFFGAFSLMLGILISPGFVFINFFILLYFLITGEIKQKVKFMIRFIASFYIIVILVYFSEIINTKQNLIQNQSPIILMRNYSQKLITEVKLLYFNYYTLRDTLPNIGMLWSLLPETFLKYQNFSHLMLVNYQIILNFSILCLTYKMDYQKKTSLTYALLFLMNHLMDRYPSENHYIISILFIVQYYEVINKTIFNLAVYGTVAAYILIFSRGHPYKAGRAGSSNYLYFQNLTYACFQVFVLLCTIFAVYEFDRKKKHEKKMKVIVTEIIEKSIDQSINH